MRPPALISWGQFGNALAPCVYFQSFSHKKITSPLRIDFFDPWC
jgi:hypothetical protein